MPNIPTEPPGSSPRSRTLIDAIAVNPVDFSLDGLHDAAVRNTIEQFDATGSPGLDVALEYAHRPVEQQAVIRARVERTALASARTEAA